MRTFPSILIKRCLTMEVTSRPVKAYFSLLRRKTVRGRDSRSLWGPGEGRVAYEVEKTKCSVLRQFPEIYGNVHKFRLTCLTSMKKGRSGASSAFWVREPSKNRRSVPIRRVWILQEHVGKRHPRQSRCIHRLEPEFRSNKRQDVLLGTIWTECTHHIVLECS